MPHDRQRLDAEMAEGEELGRKLREEMMDEPLWPHELRQENMNLNDLASWAHCVASEHGFHAPNLPPWTAPGGSAEWTEVRCRHFLAALMLITTEVAEAAEEVRRGQPDAFVEELADVIIRVLDLCGASSIDIQGAVVKKMRENETREYRHGGKIV